MIHISAPGKLMIAGEWAVLEGSKCIVAAVDKRVHVEIEANKEISVAVDDFGITDVKAEFDGKKIKWIGDAEEKLIFMKSAMETALQYLTELKGNYKPFRIRSWGEESQIIVDGIAKKVGFGSSAAAVVATVSAILRFHGLGISSNKETVYKLSTIAHYFAQGKVGSAFDVAASAYGHVIVYKRFDPDWLIKELETESVREVVDKKWPGFHVEELEMPEELVLLAGWTKDSASTAAMVKQMQSFRQSSKVIYERIYDGISSIVDELIDAFKENDREKIIILMNKNEELLRELTKKSGVNIETPELRRLSDIAAKYGCAGKLSGAGGGDCGIAVCLNEKNAEKTKKAWKESGLYPIDANIDSGVREEKS